MMVKNSISNRSYSVWEYIVRLIGIIGVSLVCFNIFGSTSTALSSFIWSSVAFLIITIFSAIVLFKDTKWIWYFVSAYMLKVIIGLLHYLYFIDPNYFFTGVYNPLTYEYDGVFNQIITTAHDKLNHGIFYYQFYEGGVTHQEILSFISIPFMFFGDYALTISPLNSFVSILISINLMLISIYKFHVKKSTLKYIAIITAYFPMTLISSLLYRDVVGLALMSVGLTLIMLSKKRIIQFLMLIIAGYLFYLQRTMYPIILLLAFVINTVVNQNYKSKGWDLFYKVVTVLVSIILVPIIISYSNTEANRNMAAGGLNVDFVVLPIKMLVGLIGPFPWTNFLLFKTFPAYAYQLQDYLQGTLQVAVVVSIILGWKKYIRKDQFNLLNITGILLIITGLFNSYMHITYVAIGFIFLIPWLFSQISLTKFNKNYLYSFLALLFLNIIVVVLFGNLGISSLWK
ncbi:MAG: hypothetical protein ACYC25_00570 [Paludibacter sp.]